MKIQAPDLWEGENAEEWYRFARLRARMQEESNRKRPITASKKKTIYKVSKLGKTTSNS